MVVLITGCRSGFGLLAAETIARAGHTVYAGLRDLRTADDLRARTAGLAVTPVQLDVTDPAQREQVVSEIEAKHGAIGALINNAGIATGGPLETFGEAELRKVFEVNLFALWALTARVLPKMREARDGVIINVSSMAGRSALPTMGVYAASKHAVTGMTEALRLELRPFGVRVALIEPGPYKTDIFGRNLRVSEAAQQPQASPYQELLSRMDALATKTAARGGDPQDVADRILAVMVDPNPPLWNAMGPNVPVRRVLRWGLPARLYERLIARIVYGR